MTRKHLAFTLIELLVVVAIIALLISILLPSLARAREQAKITLCKSNEHQIGLAMMHYTNDNADWFPCDYDGGPSMVWEYGGIKGKQGGYDAPIEARPFNRYLDPEFYVCPSDAALPGFAWETFREARGHSYPLNGYNSGGWDAFKPWQWLGIVNRRTVEVSNSDCVIIGEAVMDEYWGDTSYGNNGYGFRWHDKKKPYANVVMLDASVRYALMTPTIRTGNRGDLFWWEGIDYSFNPTAKQNRDYKWQSRPRGGR